MISQETVSTIEIKYKRLKPNLNERVRRHWAASEAIVMFLYSWRDTLPIISHQNA